MDQGGELEQRTLYPIRIYDDAVFELVSNSKVRRAVLLLNHVQCLTTRINQDHGPERLFEVVSNDPSSTPSQNYTRYVLALAEYDQWIGYRLDSIETLLTEVHNEYEEVIDPQFLTGSPSLQVWSDVFVSLFVEGACPDVGLGGNPWPDIPQSPCTPYPDCCSSFPDLCCPLCGVMWLNELPSPSNGEEQELNGEYFLTTITGPEGQEAVGHYNTSLVTPYFGKDVSGIPIGPPPPNFMPGNTQAVNGCLFKCWEAYQRERRGCQSSYLVGLSGTFVTMAWAAGAGVPVGGPAGSVAGVIFAAILSGGFTNYNFYVCLRDTGKRKDACDYSCRS